jgi:hypothetical protein
MQRVMRVILVLLLLAHGIAHLPGFLANWQLRSFPELPFRTTVFAGTFEVGPVGIKAIGAGWLLVAIAFGFAALGVLLRWGWWQPLAYGAVGASVLLSAAGWPEARLGLVANVLVVVLIVVGQRLNWL